MSVNLRAEAAVEQSLIIPMGDENFAKTVYS
jgi:hypothetical protein